MLKNRFLIILIIIIILSAGTYFFISKNKKLDYEFTIAKIGDISQKISITGKIKPQTELELDFPFSGIVERIYVNEGQNVSAGQNLISLDISGLLIDKKDALAQKDLRTAELDKLLTKPTMVLGAENIDVEQEYIDLLNKLNETYVNITALKNTLGSLLLDSNLVSILSNIYDLRDALANINTLQIESKYNFTNSNLTNTNIDAFLIATEEILPKAIKAVLLFDSILNNTIPGNNVTKTQLDAYISSVRTQKTNIKTSETDINSAKSDLISAKLTAETDIKIARAKLESAQAILLSINKKISDSLIAAPISGIITKIEIEEGERVQLGQAVIKMLSNEQFIIEANVPEADIAKIKINNPADITLDAYGNDIVFSAEVIDINPAEIIIEGVPTYKTTLKFKNEDSRIKSGMTANIDILVDSKENAVVIPQRAVKEKNGDKYVEILNDDNSISEILVQTGLRGSNGNIEIAAGLSGGEKVITFRKEK